MPARIGCAAIIAAALHVAFHLHRHGASAPTDLSASTADHLAFYRRQLERQRDLVASVSRWYLAPFVPGFVLTIVSNTIERPGPAGRGVMPWIAAAIALSVGALVFLGIAKLNRMAARKLQHEIDTLLPLPLEQTRTR